jgi:hypothetical protein
MGSFLYDNKINMHRLHSVWMFIDRNYSISNPFIAERYNPEDFPTVISTPTSLRFLYSIELNGTQVHYDCK